MFRRFLTFALLLADVSFALTGGPTQPEYVGFTPAEKTGLVDLYSGDFSYSIPLMAVPGPSFSYPITLGYRAGITTDQASTWVGLGWSLNAGAINRTLDKYPDDYAKGKSISVLEGDHTAYQRDISVSYMGIGVTVGTRSDHGFHGSLDVSAGGFSLASIGYDQKDGFGITPGTNLAENFGSIVQDQAMSAALSGINEGKLQVVEGEGLVESQGLGLSFSPTGHSLSIGVGGFGFGSSSVSVGAFHNVSHGLTIPVFTTGVFIRVAKTSTWIYKKEDVELYGYMNLSQFPKELTGDFGTNWDTKNSKMEYSWAPDQSVSETSGNSFDSWFKGLLFKQKAFALPNPDGYQALSEGLSMSFRPYHQDIGDYYGQENIEAEVDYWLTQVNNTFLEMLPYYAKKTADQKEAFDRNLGELATLFVDQTNSSTVAPSPPLPLIPNEQLRSHQSTDYFKLYDSNRGYPMVPFREAGTQGGAFLAETWRPKRERATDGRPKCAAEDGYGCDLDTRHRTNDVDDASFLNTSPHTYKAPNFDGPSSGGQFPDRISGGNGVFPLFKNAYDASGIDPAFCAGGVDIDVPQCDPAVPLKAMIGFTVVRPDGMVYEYHLPVFNWGQKTISADRPSADLEKEYKFRTFTASNSLNRAYATSWLLTAIKGPDYVDLGVKGLDDNDIGSWTGFEYQNRIRGFDWRTPYEGLNPLGVGKDEISTDNDKSLRFTSYGQASWGSKEVYFLKSIRTPSHEARFVSDVKEDGKEASISDNGSFDDLPGRSKIAMWNMDPEVGDLLRINYKPKLVSDGSGGDPQPCPEVPAQQFHVLDVSASGNTEINANNGNRALHRVVLDGSVDASLCYPDGELDDKLVVTLVSRGGDENSHMLRKLNRIELVKRDNPAKILTVAKFNYESDPAKQLSPGVPNVQTYNSANPVGKLTLRQVEIGSGNAHLPPYKFSYYMEGAQAPYHRFHWDRWGFYKHDGGLVNTQFVKSHIVDWQLLLNVLNGTATGAVFTFAKNKLQDALQPELDEADFDDLVAMTSESQLRQGHKSALLKAVNRMKNSLSLYSSCPTDIPRADAFPASAKTNAWASQALADGIIDVNGVVLKSSPTAEETNAVQGLNMGLIQEYLFKEAAPSTRSAFFRDLSANHFDHETNPEDVKAWSLKQVTLPSGGKVDVEFESDDYAYLGRTRALDLVDVDGFEKTGSLDYLKNIGIEKSVYNSTSFLKMDEGLLGDSYWENPDKVELRVSSLFHVYRKDKVSGEWELTPEFAKMQEWITAGKIGSDYSTVPPEYKIHLTGLYNSSKVNQGVMQASDCGVVFLKDQSNATVDMRAILAPFDLGTVAKPFQINEAETEAWKEAHCCQTNYVDFSLSDINFGNLESKLKDVNCTEIRDGQKGFLKNLNYLTLAWGRRREQDPSAAGYNQDWPKILPLYGLTRYVKLYAGNVVDPATLPATTPSLLVSPVCANPSSNNNYRTDDCTITYLKDGKWIGPGSWNILQEFSPIAAASPNGGLDAAPKDDWEFMSFNIGKRVKSGDPVAMAAGIPGGGLRVKRISYNSGWPQRPGEPPQAQVTEYSYDCAGANGGVYSAGATASLPPPYSNKGDDRIPVPPQIGLVQGQPSVGYRRVTEVRPGRGKIVYDFLSPADVSDFISYENCNSANIDADGDFLGTQAGCYDADHQENWPVTAHARWKVHRLSQFQGLLTAKVKLREKNAEGVEDTVASQKFRFLTSLSKNDLGQLYLTSLLNNSDAVGMSGVLESSEALSLQAGSRDFPFQTHPTSAHMGEAVERLRLRWYYGHNREITDPEMPVRALIGLNEMEIVEHSIRQVESIDKVDGVGTKTAHAYFDFLTGEPVVSEISALKAGEIVDASIPTKTIVTVPAHWVGEYNPAPSTSTPVSMGTVYEDPRFFDFATGNLLYGESVSSLMKKKNMLTQPFSQSTYSGLPPFCAEGSPGCAFTLSLFAGEKILNRNVTTWALAAQGSGTGSTAAWRKDESFSLKLPMDKSTRKVVVDRGAIGSPLPLIGVEEDFRNNPAYVLDSRVLKYGDLGEALEVRDALDVRVSSFYQNHKYLVGQVLNSDLASCAVLSMDELTALNNLWTHTGTLTTDAARSGETSLILSTGGTLKLRLQTAKGGKAYEFSIWSKDPNHRGTYEAKVNGVVQESGALAYRVNDAEWQRTLVSLDLTSNTGEVDVAIEMKATGGSLWLDDARFAPSDAQVFSMTYDNRTYQSSMSDPNDVLTRFQYDAFGRLVEVRDHQGVLLSTQARMEAK